MLNQYNEEIILLCDVYLIINSMLYICFIKIIKRIIKFHHRLYHVVMIMKIYLGGSFFIITVQYFLSYKYVRLSLTETRNYFTALRDFYTTSLSGEFYLSASGNTNWQIECLFPFTFVTFNFFCMHAFMRTSDPDKPALNDTLISRRWWRYLA